MTEERLWPNEVSVSSPFRPARQFSFCRRRQKFLKDARIEANLLKQNNSREFLWFNWIMNVRKGTNPSPWFAGSRILNGQRKVCHFLSPRSSSLLLRFVTFARLILLHLSYLLLHNCGASLIGTAVSYRGRSRSAEISLWAPLEARLICLSARPRRPNFYSFGWIYT